MKKDHRIYLLVLALLLVLLLAHKGLITVQNKEQSSRITAMGYNPNGGCLYTIVNDQDNNGNSLKKLFIFVHGKLVGGDPCYESSPLNYQTGMYEDDRIVLGPFSARGGRLTGPNGLSWNAPPLNPVLDRVP